MKQSDHSTKRMTRESRVEPEVCEGGLRVYEPPIAGTSEDFIRSGRSYCKATIEQRDHPILPLRGPFCCSAEHGHDGDHAAHDAAGRMRARWPRGSSETQGRPEGLRVYDPPIRPGHPDWLACGQRQGCPARSEEDSSGKRWHCTLDYGHSTDHAGHTKEHLLGARWPRDPEPLPSPEAAESAATEADAMIALALVDTTRDAAVTAIDRLRLTGDPQWHAAAEHFVRALHALALAGSGVEVEDGGGE